MRRERRRYYAVMLMLIFVCGIVLTACQGGLTGGEKGQNQEVQKEFFTMDTYMTFSLYGEKAGETLKDAEAKIRKLESEWSVTNQNSEIYQVNHSNGNPVTLSEDTAEVVRYALDMAKETGGALDPTIYPVLTAWGFTTGKNRVPKETEIRTLLEHVGYEKVILDGQTLTLPEEMELDLGAVGKGYAGDLTADLVKEHGLESALLNIGGNIQAVGSRPDGEDWRLAIRSPYGEGEVGLLKVSDCAVVTSGNYERYFTAKDGTRYGHIIDPKTGYPVDNGLASVTIVTEEGKMGDALSTALFVKGLDGAKAYWQSHDGFEMIVMTEDQKLYVTEGLDEKFTLSGTFSQMERHVIRR